MCVTATSSIQIFWQNDTVAPEFRTGVSLHSHTMCSEESLAMVPQYTARIPYVGEAIRRQELVSVGKNTRQFSFNDAFWTPPLAPRQAYRLEKKQIQRQFKLPALVSLTDHDDIRAASMLRVLDRFSAIPISSEWTIPYGGTFFHLGVHNLPPADAASIWVNLAAFTAHPTERGLTAILAMLNSLPDVLLVLNHPLWDEKGIGIEQHARILRELLNDHGQDFHGLELNGLRPWDENQKVMTIARDLNLPVLSGGDRHGREPSAVLNLSRAATFPEFVHEVRRDRFSQVVFMPQYREPMSLRILQTMVDVVRDYPKHPEGRRTWSDRVFYRDPETGETIPMAVVWEDGGPRVIKQFVAAMRVLEWRGIRSALKLAFHGRPVLFENLEASF